MVPTASRIIRALTLSALLSIGLVAVPGPGATGFGPAAAHTSFPVTSTSIVGYDDTYAVPLKVDALANIIGWSVYGTIAYDRAVDDHGLMMGIQHPYGNTISTAFWGRYESGVEVTAAGFQIDEVYRQGSIVIYSLQYTAYQHMNFVAGDYKFIVAAPEAYSVSLTAEVAYDYGPVHMLGTGHVSNHNGTFYDIAEFDGGATVRAAALSDTVISAFATHVASPSNDKDRVLVDWQFGPGAGRYRFETRGADRDVSEARTEVAPLANAQSAARVDGFAVQAKGDIVLHFQHAAYLATEPHAFRFAQIDLPID